VDTASDPSRRVSLRLFLGPPHPCPYLPQRQARFLIVDPAAPLTGGLLQQLMDQGFRRGGSEVYRPHCRGCRACVSLRIPAQAFRTNRSQRRCWRFAEQEISLRDRPGWFDPDHYALYLRYQQARHPDGTMGNASAAHYHGFLVSPWCETRFWELRWGERLIAVAVVDLLPQGLSAVYTFFEPDMAAFSPGKLAVLWQIAEARRRGLDSVYLGFWVQSCRKMHYKDQYRPLDAWDGTLWRRFGPAEPIDFANTPE
jgi:leucyl-tRNA---protein transferase